MARHKNRVTSLKINQSTVKIFRTHYASFVMDVITTDPEGEPMNFSFPCRISIADLADITETLQQKVLNEVARRASGAKATLTD